MSLGIEEDQPSNLVQSVCDRAKLKINFRYFDMNLQDLVLSDDRLILIRDLGNQEALRQLISTIL